MTFTILPFALCALAVFLAAGWRRIVLRRIGWCLLGLGIAVLLARLLIGHWIVDALVGTPSVRSAGTSAWLIGSSMLRNVAIALAVCGAVVVLAAWLTPRRGTRAVVGTRARDEMLRQCGLVAAASRPSHPLSPSCPPRWRSRSPRATDPRWRTRRGRAGPLARTRRSAVVADG